MFAVRGYECSRYSLSCVREQGHRWMKHLSPREMEQIDLLWHEYSEPWEETYH